MKTVVVSPNFGKFDKDCEWEEQIDCDVIRLDDSNFHTRINAFTPRMHSKLIRTLAWQILPGYDTYIYVDASFKLKSGAVQWILNQLGMADIVFFEHPWRGSIAEEYIWMKKALADGKRYVRYRYEHEFLEDQYRCIAEDKSFTDDLLLCGGIFAYHNIKPVRDMLKEWWFHISRYHMNDQLSLPYVLKKSGCLYGVIHEDIFKLKYFPHMRHS